MLAKTMKYRKVVFADKRSPMAHKEQIETILREIREDLESVGDGLFEVRIDVATEVSDEVAKDMPWLEPWHK